MKSVTRSIVSCIAVVLLSMTLGCSKKADQPTPPAPQPKAEAPSAETATPPSTTEAPAAGINLDKPISEIVAEAQAMGVEALKATATKYKEVIVAKRADLENLAAKIKQMPITEALGQEAKTLKTEYGNIQTSLKALTERFQVYYDALQKKGGDTSGLAL